MLHKMCVKGGLKVHPGIMALVVLLGGEGISNKMVPVKEPMGLKDIEDIKDRKLTVIRDNRLCVHWNRRDNGGHRGTSRSRRGRGSLFCPFG